MELTVEQSRRRAEEEAEAYGLVFEAENARYEALVAKSAARAHADEMREGRNALLLIVLGFAVAIALIALLLRVS